MLNLERSWSHSETVDGRGRPVTLISRRISIAFSTRRGAGGAAYERPSGVVHNGRVTPIVDLVMITKLVGLIAVLAAMIVRTVRR